MEAVFDIKASQQKIGKELGKRVAAIYPDFDGLAEWIEGLYIRRCDFTHGDSGEDRQNMPQHMVRTYENFEKRKGRWTVLRGLCLDLIRREVERTMSSSPPLRLYNKESDLMEAYFKSNGLWTGLKKQFSIQNAGNAIHELTGDAKSKFQEVVTRFLESHRWYCMAELPEPSRVTNILKSVVATLLNCPDAEQGEKDEALQVSRSAKDGDVESIRIWVAHHEEWREFGQFERPMVGSLKAVILQVARYYDEVN